MQAPTSIMRSLARRGASTVNCAALVLAFGVGASCRPDLTARVDCDQFKYAGPSFETTTKIGKFGAELASKGEMREMKEMVRQVDEGVEGSITRWNAACQEFNAGTRGHDELRRETQTMRRLDARLWQMDHAADAAAYQASFQILHEAMVAPVQTPTPG